MNSRDILRNGVLEILRDAGSDVLPHTVGLCCWGLLSMFCYHARRKSPLAVATSTCTVGLCCWGWSVTSYYHVERNVVSCPCSYYCTTTRLRHWNLYESYAIRRRICNLSVTNMAIARWESSTFCPNLQAFSCSFGFYKMQGIYLVGKEELVPHKDFAEWSYLWYWVKTRILFWPSAFSLKLRLWRQIF